MSSLSFSFVLSFFLSSSLSVSLCGLLCVCVCGRKRACPPFYFILFYPFFLSLSLSVDLCGLLCVWGGAKSASYSIFSFVLLSLSVDLLSLVFMWAPPCLPFLPIYFFIAPSLSVGLVIERRTLHSWLCVAAWLRSPSPPRLPPTSVLLERDGQALRACSTTSSAKLRTDERPTYLNFPSQGVHSRLVRPPPPRARARLVPLRPCLHPGPGATSVFTRRLCAAGPMAHPFRHGGCEGELGFHREAIGGGGREAGVLCCGGHGG